MSSVIVFVEKVWFSIKQFQSMLVEELINKLEDIVGFQEIDDVEIRKASTKLAMKISAKQLISKIKYLFECQCSDCDHVRKLSRNLAKKIHEDDLCDNLEFLTSCMDSRETHVSILAIILLASIPNEKWDKKLNYLLRNMGNRVVQSRLDKIIINMVRSWSPEEKEKNIEVLAEYGSMCQSKYPDIDMKKGINRALYGKYPRTNIGKGINLTILSIVSGWDFETRARNRNFIEKYKFDFKPNEIADRIVRSLDKKNTPKQKIFDYHGESSRLEIHNLLPIKGYFIVKEIKPVDVRVDNCFELGAFKPIEDQIEILSKDFNLDPTKTYEFLSNVGRCIRNSGKLIAVIRGSMQAVSQMNSSFELLSKFSIVGRDISNMKDVKKMDIRRNWKMHSVYDKIGRRQSGEIILIQVSNIYRDRSLQNVLENMSSKYFFLNITSILSALYTHQDSLWKEFFIPCVEDNYFCFGKKAGNFCIQYKDKKIGIVNSTQDNQYEYMPIGIVDL